MVRITASAFLRWVGDRMGNVHFQPHRFAVLKWCDVCVCVCVCACGWNELKVCTMMSFSHISVYSVLWQCIHTNTRILKPFEDSELTGLKVDIATECEVGQRKCCCRPVV